ncbi:MAG TPA: hypothetical protein VLA61_13435 [Ideonella sp.]|uniref:hypothetical protein n=1 Tax=Ideonella sp. TaxID=1929293 RepID=UPI002B9D40C6|nr:hypothetical protein [Ideonella sp.]HSI49270.1 hypothetical protein [Ideonella sp.]
MNSTTFLALMQREWMQHRRGWLIFSAVPLCMMLFAIVVGNVHVSSDESALSVLVALAGGYIGAVMMLGWVGAGFQSSGLGQRDRQDRSIEFWRSLPVSDWAAVGATALMHVLVFQLMVAGIAFVCGLVVAVLTVARVYGLGGLASLPWGTLGTVIVAAVPRVLVAVGAAALWAAPVMLFVMAASAWLKRWGGIAAVGALGLGGVILAKVYQMPWLLQTLATMAERFRDAIFPVARHDFESFPWDGQLTQLPQWLLSDTHRVLGELVDPAMGWGLVLAVLSFVLLVLRRQRA